MKLLKSAVIIGVLSYIIYLLQPTSYPITNRIPDGETIVAFGDSLTFGTGASAADSYPQQLSRLIGEEIINLGVPGDTTADALARIDTVIEKNPRIVLLTIGGNDLKNGINKDSAFANIRKIIEQLQASGAMVIIGGIDIPVLDRGFNDEYKSLAKETRSVLLPNVLKGIMGNRKLMSDSIHPNAAGYKIMAERFHEIMKPFLINFELS